MAGHIYRRKIQREQATQGDLLTWDDLKKMDGEQLREVAEGMGIAWKGRMKTASAINKALKVAE